MFDKLSDIINEEEERLQKVVNLSNELITVNDIERIVSDLKLD